ncbi:response regulator transcription factor [Chitinophaga horti]|uniref:Response regulator transcription factor n=1 Tax=Chitinophaga horti TaxID=2920382 RepID=A0ABY6J7Z3_9BACT|nr:response regulator transcription factor [Chitinophaga horti]UYQ95758.1 response regulator transcription factor [Chitinophaga horti]
METNRILLVEDEARIADMLSFGLRENGYDVDVAYDGSLGYRMYDGGGFDLLVLDINLPGMNGFEFCKRVRAGDEKTPIIMLTALGALDDKIEGYDAGADDYISKPFEFRELLMKIRALLRRSGNVAAPAGNLLRAGDLVMNLDTREVKRDGKDIYLTAKELQLLEYLMRNKNRVVSRADIAVNVWSINFDTSTNIIDVYINYVRNKVDKPFDQKMIHTQVGLGYVLKDH